MDKVSLDILADACAQRVCDRIEPKLAPLADLPVRVKALEDAEADRKEATNDGIKHRREFRIAIGVAIAGSLISYFAGKF